MLQFSLGTAMLLRRYPRPMYNRPRCTRLGVVAIEGTYLTRVKVIYIQGDKWIRLTISYCCSTVVTGYDATINDYNYKAMLIIAGAKGKLSKSYFFE